MADDRAPDFLAGRDVAFRSDFHLPGTCRGVMVTRLQRLPGLRPDGVFAPSATRAATPSTADPSPDP